MAAPKGNKFSKGRPPGAQSKVTKEFKEALNELLQLAAPQMVEWLGRVAETDPAKALDQVGKLAEYVHPKLSRSTIGGDPDAPIKHDVNVNFVSSKIDTSA